MREKIEPFTRRLRSGELTAVATDPSPNAQISLPLRSVAERSFVDSSPPSQEQTSSPPQQRALAVAAESYMPSPSQLAAVTGTDLVATAAESPCRRSRELPAITVAARRHHRNRPRRHRSREPLPSSFFRFPSPLQQQRALFLRGICTLSPRTVRRSTTAEGGKFVICLLYDGNSY
nr:hypothetical protein Iba_chr02bCG20370 [Ipomoea batatas]